ncbi:hypothetical protein [Lentzea albidocapillata]|uniref:Apolipoprotein N-acyltransferase n=1 Tax=Lentzea albidocapillata TaxID=40571 RepID=A0A1W2B2K7_9PSEU|nr:hypothetical protein [Lentzea albidocapillata]SMC67074.1 hypothetical protein SAMN05660733_00983 [Lentzea albidocapillata]
MIKKVARGATEVLAPWVLHAAVAWAAVVTPAIVHSPWWLLLALPAAFVAWSRAAGGGSFWLLS